MQEVAHLTSRWTDAVCAAAMFAVDPPGTGGVVLRALPGPVRDGFLMLLREFLPEPASWTRVPLHVADDRLLGGLDLGATLASGRPVAERGLLAEADGGVLLLAMAERMGVAESARLIPALDTREVVLERNGVTERIPTSFGVIALDEGIAHDERAPAGLCDRLAFHVDLTPIGIHEAILDDPGFDFGRARTLLPDVVAKPAIAEALCAVGLSLGIGSIRAAQLALRAARLAAALDGRRVVSEDDATLAARLVLAPRATALPDAEPAPEESPEPSPKEDPPNDVPVESAEPDDPGESTSPDEAASTRFGERVLEATRAAIPADLLDQLKLQSLVRTASRKPGGAGALRRAERGRPIGVRRGRPGGGARLNVVETLRAAAPWQRLRRSETGVEVAGAGLRRSLQIRRDDLRLSRFEQRSETTTIFVVDASGSALLQRLAEVKGAIELLLNQCYVRRDRVALIAFRGTGAELLLPATRSLVRAKRELASLAGGGGTPLAAGIEAATDLARSVARSGGTPLIVFLTDGRANIARDTTADRTRAEADAIGAAHVLRSGGLAAMLVDSSPRPRATAERLAREMGAAYLPLPHADAESLSEAVRHTAADLDRAVAGR